MQVLRYSTILCAIWLVLAAAATVKVEPPPAKRPEAGDYPTAES
jgi:hypothetical protein